MIVQYSIVYERSGIANKNYLLYLYKHVHEQVTNCKLNYVTRKTCRFTGKKL